MPEDVKTRTQRSIAEQQKAIRETGPYMTLGIQLVLTILAFFGIGYWLDQHFKTGSLWTAIFAGFGAFASLTYFIVTVIRLQKLDNINRQKAETKAR